MKRKVYVFVPLVLFLAIALYAQKVDKEGKAWLDRYTDPAEINVTGMWESIDWGLYEFNQEEGSREITGRGEWKVKGVVSGNNVYLLFTWDGEVEYSAELKAEGDDKLVGSYSSEIMSEKSDRKPILFKKQL